MRRLIVACAFVLALMAVPSVAAVPAHADTSTSPNCTTGGPGTQTCTVHGYQVVDLGPGCGLADVVLAGNSVFHITVNKAGDSWVTGTVEGTLTGTDALGTTVLTGHGQLWFGSENNRQNDVQHFTANGNGTLTDGTHVGFHINGDITTNANGQITASHMNFDCRN